MLKDFTVKQAIETLIDTSSLADVLLGLELVCAEKAEHIMENWQAEEVAALWRKAGRHCGRLARYKDIAFL